MAETLTFQGNAASAPTFGNPSGFPGVSADYAESLQLASSAKFLVTLASDAPVAVPLPGMASVSFVSMRATGGKVTAAVTSTDGATQAIPVDPLLLLLSQSVPLTAISLTRVAGTPTTVEVFLGQLAT